MFELNKIMKQKNDIRFIYFKNAFKRRKTLTSISVFYLPIYISH